MTDLIVTIVFIIAMIVIFVVIPILAIQLLIYVAPVLLVVYILYKIFGPKKPKSRGQTQHYDASQSQNSDDVIDVEFTVHESKDDDPKDRV